MSYDMEHKYCGYIRRITLYLEISAYMEPKFVWSEKHEDRL
jgi:hypothetical protein